MATLKGQTIAASYQDLVKRADTYAQAGTNIELMDDSGDVQATGLYLESNATTSNVGIGIAAPARNLHINSSGSTEFEISSTGDTSNTFMKFNSDSDGTPRAAILGIDHSDNVFRLNHGASFDGTNNGIAIDSSGDVTFTGDLIMADGKGINFAAMTSPADAAGMTAEILDDYEEGTWDAVVTDGTNPMTMDSSYDTGYYTKVGNLVTVTGFFVTTSLGSASGAIRITGLPFTIVNNAAAYTTGGARGGGMAITAGHSVSYYGEIGNTNIHLEVWDDTGGVSAMQASEWTADGQIILGFSYRAA